MHAVLLILGKLATMPDEDAFDFDGELPLGGRVSPDPSAGRVSPDPVAVDAADDSARRCRAAWKEADAARRAAGGSGAARGGGRRPRRPPTDRRR